ncbi:MAG: P-loop NTPase [Candidatus Aenigmarchaeota archaeon]|nr:P-loop NTPase [Candidatus Aenigmarchaeota archaeon]
MVYGTGTKIIGVSSGKGGVGKTTFSINLSAALYEMGYQNILVDGDISNANLSVQLGLQHNTITVQDLVTEKLNPMHAIRIHHSGLRILPAALSIQKANVEMHDLRTRLSPLNETFIMDFPPGIARNVEQLMELCDEIIVLTTPEVTSITDAVKTVELAKQLRKPFLGMVVNRVSGEWFELTPAEIQSMSESHILGTIAEDKKVKRSNFESLPYVFRYPYSKAAIDTRLIACRLLGKPYSGPKYNFLRNLLER